MDFEGKHVLVTGASRGIGHAIARRFAELGATVVAHYGRRRDEAEALVAELPGSGHGTAGADLANADAAEGLIERAAELGRGRLDVLVNNAGMFEDHPPATASWDTWRGAWERTLAVNLLAPAHLSYFAARRMIEQGGGRIVNVSSRGAFRGEPDAPAYGASKAGLNALSQSMAKALAPHGVFVYAVAPGWVATDMAAPFLGQEGPASIEAQSPLHRVARPEEIAEAVVFCASERTEFMTGAILDVNGASYLRT